MEDGRIGGQGPQQTVPLDNDIIIIIINYLGQIVCTLIRCVLA